MDNLLTVCEPTKGAEIDRRTVSAMKYFGLNDVDVSKGLTYLKQTTKKRFAEIAKHYHPDTYRQNRSKPCHPCTGREFRIATRAYRIIMALRVVPITPNNVEAVLEITKGYLTTEDVDIPD